MLRFDVALAMARRMRLVTLRVTLSLASVSLACSALGQAQPPPPTTGQGEPAKAAGQGKKPTTGQGQSPPAPAAAQQKAAQPKPSPWYELAGQATMITQQLFPFHSPYRGPNSLPPRGAFDATETATGYLGARVTKELEVFVDPEVALGNGVGRGNGLGGFTNDDLIGQQSLSSAPYLARYFVRYRLPLGHAAEEPQIPIGRASNLIEGKAPKRRLVFTLGKMAVADLFDVNLYANDPHTQFLNDALCNNAAYDYSQDTRGYSVGFVASWVNPDFSVKYGIFQSPTVPGGPDLSGDLPSRNGQQIEVTDYLRTFDKHRLTTFRLLAYSNDYDAGSFGAAIANAMGGTPDLESTRAGALKYGFGLNMEQPLGDGGATGLFARWGWNNGTTESSRSEVDRAFSLGMQISGAKWRRKSDKVGIAFAQNDLSGIHKLFLMSGGIGTTLGDGSLDYASEHVVEGYYAYQATKMMSLSLDYQWIGDPGYNADRGPASVVSFRVHFDF